MPSTPQVLGPRKSQKTRVSRVQFFHHHPSQLLHLPRGGHHFPLLQSLPNLWGQLHFQPDLLPRRKGPAKRHRPESFMLSCIHACHTCHTSKSCTSDVIQSCMIPTTHMHEQEPSFPPPGWAGNLYCTHACNFSLYFFLYLFPFIVRLHQRMPLLRRL